ncbi:MAG TPA: hypothetical protein VF245_12055 [Solirubrobacterales bacterium]
MRRLALVPAVATFLAAAVLGPASAGAAACPSFRVLHDDRIGSAVLPAGSYAVEPAAGSGLTCADASRLFTRFLEDWDGVLPRPWRVVARGRGEADFRRGEALGFTVSRTGGGEGGRSNELGQLCPNTFTVNAAAQVGPLFFARGGYLLYLPPRSGITCRRASVIFTRFLGIPNGRLPAPWRVRTQTATFFKPTNPTRSAFRVEPANGTGPR